MFVDWGNIRAVVLDFDCTITMEHTGGRAESPDQISEKYIRDNIKNVFVDFVKEAQRQGIALWIATYGDDGFALSRDDVVGHDLVKRYMDVLFGPEQIIFRAPVRNAQDEIVRYQNVIAKLSGDRKAFHWNIIREQMGESFKPHEVLFLDDSAPNLDYARELGCELLVSGSSDKAALVCASGEVFSLLLDRMRLRGEPDGVE